MLSEARQNEREKSKAHYQYVAFSSQSIIKTMYDLCVYAYVFICVGCFFLCMAILVNMHPLPYLTSFSLYMMCTLNLKQLVATPFKF